MPQTGASGAFTFTYTDAVLKDFEALYLQKKEISPATRIVLGAIGLAGCLYFGYSLYTDGAQLTRIGYLIICSILLVVALARPKSRPDDTLAKYRKYYLNTDASFAADETGVELKLAGQKNYARSKYREIYALYDTDRCYYLLVKGRAYYILPKEAVDEANRSDFVRALEKRSGRKFQHLEV